MSNQKKVINVTFPSSLVGLVFILLKVTETVTWPWVWVLAPFWLPWAVIASVLLAAVAVALLASIGVGLGYFINLLRSRK